LGFLRLPETSGHQTDSTLFADAFAFHTMVRIMADDTTIFIIEKFTMLTDFVEDRIRMNMVNAHGATIAIWLTRRLLDRFLPVMIKHVEGRASPSLPIKLSLSMSQQKLRQDRQQNPCQPVLQPLETMPWLGTTMRLFTQENGAVWALIGDAGQEARIFLSDTNVRAALDILHNNYAQMEWGRGHFPEWIVDAVQPIAPGNSVLH
jgi:hypothetical protein